MSQYFPVRVADTAEEIGGNAKSVVFDIPAELAQQFVWKAGQHLNIRVYINGEEFRRSYSISSSYDAGDPLRITVKRVHKGKVSNFINDHVVAGQTIEIMPPSGSFWVKPSPKGYKTYYFFGAGSGITPLYAMIRSILSQEPHSMIYLVYGNANAKSAMLIKEIEQLVTHYPKRMVLANVFSDWTSWLASDYWRTGRIDKACVEAALTEFPPYAQDAQYYICGPGDMNTSIRKALRANDVVPERIHSESYGGEAAPTLGEEGGVAAALTVHVGGQVHEVPVDAGEPLLRAIRRANITVPFSCQAGVCGSCRAKLTRGEVDMATNAALEQDELNRGMVLSCQSRAQTPAVTLVFPE